MIDLLGIAMITTLDITAMDYVATDARAYNNDAYDVSEYYAKAPTLYVQGFVPINDKLRMDFNLNTGTHTKKMTATGAGTLGFTYNDSLFNSNQWSYSTSISWSRSADVQHRPCTHGDRYQRQFSCGIGGIIAPFSQLSNVSGKWSEPSISLTLTHKF